MIKLSNLVLEASMESLSKLQKAEHIATLIHASMIRKGSNSPYILHPMRIRAMAELLGYDEDTQVVAYLHDTIEDTLYKQKVKEIIERIFGKRILDAVLLLTHEKGEIYNEYLLKLAQNTSDIAQISFRVKMLDMLDNIKETPTERQKLKYKTAIEYLLANGIPKDKIPDIIIIELGINR